MIGSRIATFYITPRLIGREVYIGIKLLVIKDKRWTDERLDHADAFLILSPQPI